MTVTASPFLGGWRLDRPAGPPSENTRLVYSTSSDRSSPATLANSSIGGSSFLFLTAESNATRALFVLYRAGVEVYRRTDSDLPFDLAGGSSSAANPISALELAADTYTLECFVSFDDGREELAVATFTYTGTPVGDWPAPSPQYQSLRAIMEGAPRGQTTTMLPGTYPVGGDMNIGGGSSGESGWKVIYGAGVTIDGYLGTQPAGNGATGYRVDGDARVVLVGFTFRGCHLDGKPGALCFVDCEGSHSRAEWYEGNGIGFPSYESIPGYFGSLSLPRTARFNRPSMFAFESGTDLYAVGCTFDGIGAVALRSEAGGEIVAIGTKIYKTADFGVGSRSSHESYYERYAPTRTNVHSAADIDDRFPPPDDWQARKVAMHAADPSDVPWYRTSDGTIRVGFLSPHGYARAKAWADGGVGRDITEHIDYCNVNDGYTGWPGYDPYDGSHPVAVGAQGGSGAGPHHKFTSCHIKGEHSYDPGPPGTDAGTKGITAYNRETSHTLTMTVTDTWFEDIDTAIYAWETKTSGASGGIDITFSGDCFFFHNIDGYDPDNYTENAKKNPPCRVETDPWNEGSRSASSQWSRGGITVTANASIISRYDNRTRPTGTNPATLWQNANLPDGYSESDIRTLLTNESDFAWP